MLFSPFLCVWQVLVRTRQMLSIMETQWSGASLVVVSPGEQLLTLPSLW